MISLVIPVYNEEILIEELFERTRKVMQAISDDFEVILVDDGSTDKTLSKLKSCNLKDKRFKALALSRNFAAITTCSQKTGIRTNYLYYLRR